MRAFLPFCNPQERRNRTLKQRRCLKQDSAIESEIQMNPEISKGPRGWCAREKCMPRNKRKLERKPTAEQTAKSCIRYFQPGFLSDIKIPHAFWAIETNVRIFFWLLLTLWWLKLKGKENKNTVNHRVTLLTKTCFYWQVNTSSHCKKCRSDSHGGWTALCETQIFVSSITYINMEESTLKGILSLLQSIFVLLLFVRFDFSFAIQTQQFICTYTCACIASAGRQPPVAPDASPQMLALLYRGAEEGKREAWNLPIGSPMQGSVAWPSGSSQSSCQGGRNGWSGLCMLPGNGEWSSFSAGDRSVQRE